MKLIRVIQYEGSEEDIRRHLDHTLLSAQRVVRPGDDVPGIGLILAKPGAPQVVISLIEERGEPS